MKKYTISLLLIFFAIYSFGQNEFHYTNDFDTILAKSKDSSDDFYYKKLLERFQKNDTTLTSKEVLALMIGYTSNENYNPYQYIGDEREILNLVRQKDYKAAIRKCDVILRTNPFSFVALMEKGFSLWKLGNDEFHEYKFRQNLVLDAIIYSGDGSLQNAFFVLSPLDGQVLISYIWQGNIGTMGSGSDENDNFIDILEMEKDGESSIKHFNIQHAMLSLMK